MFKIYSSWILNECHLKKKIIGWESHDTALQASSESFGNDLNSIINIHCIPLILNIIWKTLESHSHWVCSVLHDLRTTCQFLETCLGYRVQMGSSHVLIMFPSCARDPAFARLQRGKKPKPQTWKHALASQAHWAVEKCWQQDPIMQIAVIRM